MRIEELIANILEEDILITTVDVEQEIVHFSKFNGVWNLLVSKSLLDRKTEFKEDASFFDILKDYSVESV
jgi:aromatic ring-opening dioxygenase LigB subunit